MDMLIVNILVSKDRVEDFIAVTRENAARSREEAGITRFELLQDKADPCRFALIEGYRDAEAQARHKESPHYATWKSLAEPMMAEARTRTLYAAIDPAT